jgi:hypothetical protein
MRHCRQVQPDALLAAVLCKDSLCKVCPIVSDDTVWDSISRDDLVEELDGGRAIEFLYWLGLDPLGEFVHCYQQMRQAPRYGFECSHHVKAPDRE